MPILIWELYDSRELDVSIENPSAKLAYMVTSGTPLPLLDETLVRLTVEATIPGTYGPPGGVLPFQRYAIKHLGGGNWRAEVHYGPRFPRGWQTTLPGGQGRLVSFDIATQSTKITQSLDTVASYVKEGDPPAPDNQGAIGVNGDKVEGCEIDTPAITFQETAYYERTVVDLDFFNALVDVANAPVNQTPFRGRDPGEVRYLGTHGAERDYENWELTHRFAVSLNTDTLQVGDIGPIHKDGWDYAWTRYEDAVDSNALVKQPKAVYVEQVYERSDFSIFNVNGDGSAGDWDWSPGEPLGNS